MSHTDILFLAADAADLLQESRHSFDLVRRSWDGLADADQVTLALALVKLSKLLWNSGDPA